MKFLTARWEHLLLANYRIEPDILRPLVPRGTQIDEFQGHVFVSLVAFMFSRTRILGIPVPGHLSFEEVNLRFYVTPDHDRTRRAVTFIREIVPRRAIPLVANSLFHENYVALPMSHEHGERKHCYRWKNGYRNSISATLQSIPTVPPAGSPEEFIAEHYWGYSKGPRHTIEYQVEHPPWKCCAVADYLIDVDFGTTYGEGFSFLQEMKPWNVLYASGSNVSVSFPRRIRS